MLFGSTVMTALMGDGRYNRGLSVWPAVSRNAGAFAQTGAGTVRRHQELGPDRRTIAEHDIHAGWFSRKVGHRRRDENNAGRYRPGGKRSEQPAILDHVSERFTRRDLTLESQKHWSRCIVNATIGDHHFEDGLRLVGHRRPNAKGFKHTARRGRDCGSASIATRFAKFRIC